MHAQRCIRRRPDPETIACEAIHEKATTSPCRDLSGGYLSLILTFSKEK
jgi:hypothetical protein